MHIMNTLGPSLGELGTAAVPTNLRLDVSQGPIEVTGVQTDLAVEGDGLFVVRTGSGVAYTRAGDFQTDSTGTLCTEQGYPVLDTTGHTIQPGAKFTVAADGTIAGTGQRVALVGWPPGGVSRLGENLYSAGGQLSPASGSIRQNMLEHSNTDLATSMTELVQLQRNFQMSSRALSLQDGTVGDAISLGRLR
jgi:flagellar basal body rod protein FlgG